MTDGARHGGWLFTSLRGLELSWLPRDAVAGLMLLAIAIPGQLATARLAGMPPESGLFAFAAGSLGFAALGANRFMSVGADSTIASIFAGSLAALAAGDPARYANLAAVFALLVGAILVAAGLLRAGWIADLLSIPVTTGFLAGISVHIIIGQLPGILGLPDAGGHILVRLVDVVRHLKQANLQSACIGAGVLAATVLAQRISAKVPGALIGLVAAAVAVWQLGLQHHGVAVLGALSASLPSLSVPIPTFGDVARLLPLALTVALVCMMQTAAVARTYPSDPDDDEDMSQDFAGVGAGSILAAFIGAFAVDASPPSTAIVAESGGRSQLAQLMAVATIVLLVALAGQAFAYVPVAALGGVLVFIGLRIFRLQEMVRIAHGGGAEILLVAASAFLVIALPIETGMMLSVVLSLLHSLYAVARPACVELARLPGTTIWWSPEGGETGEREPGVLVFAPAAPINFTNANYIRGRVVRALARGVPPIRLVVIDGSGVDSIDFTGARLLQQLIVSLRKRGVDVAIARLGAERARRSAAVSGLLATLGQDHVFHSAEEAVRALRPRQGGEDRA